MHMRVLTNRTRVSLAARRRTRFALAASVLPMVLCAAAILWAQNPGSDEIHVSSRPYTPPAQTVLQVKTQLVEVGVVVRDAKGHTVPGLKQGDFQILDNGKPQNISTFSIEKFTAATDTEPVQPSGTAPSATPAVPPATARPPRFVAIYFDDIDTEAGDMDRAKVAASGLAKNGVEAGDQIGIFTGSGTVTSEFTSDASKILEAIGRVTQHPRMPVNGFPGCPKVTPYQAYLIVNHLDPTMYQQVITEAIPCVCEGQEDDPQCAKTAQQAVDSKAQTTWDAATQVSQTTLFTLKQIVNYLSQRPGERVLVVASSGYLVGDESDTVQEAVISLALHQGVVINSLDLKGLYAEGPGGGVDGLKEINKNTQSESPYLDAYDSITRGQRLSFQTASLADLATGTGGTFFHNRNDLGAGFLRLADAPEVAYLLAFSPENLKPDGKYHKLKVALNGQSYPFVLARPGYFAPTKESEKAAATAAPTPQEKREKELFTSDAPTDVPDEITAESGRDKSGQPILWVGIHIDMKKLQFQKQKDRSVQTLTFLMALLDEKGNFVTGKEGAMNLALKDATLDHLMVTGLNAKLFLDAPPGVYQLRAVTQEAIEGKMTAMTTSVEIK
jgi:VWFA-related protein